MGGGGERKGFKGIVTYYVSPFQQQPLRGAVGVWYNLFRGYSRNFVLFALPPTVFTYSLIAWAKKADEADDRANAH